MSQARVAVHRPSRRLHALLLSLLLVMGTASCVAEPEPIMRLGTSLWPGYVPLYMAKDMFPVSTKSLHLVEYQSATEVLRAFRNNAIDAAALTLDEVMLLAESGEEPRILLVMDVSNGADALIGGAEMRRLREIKGRRVGVENGALGAYMLNRALQSVGLGLKDVHVIPLTVEEHVPAFAAGRVDAVITFDPMRARLLARGGRSLFDSAQIPGEIVDVLVTNKTFLDQHPDVVRSVLRAWFMTVDHYHAQPEAALHSIAGYLGLTESETRHVMAGLHLPALKENIAMLGGARPTLRVVAERLSRLMLEQQLLQHEVASAGLLNPAPLESLLP